MRTFLPALVRMFLASTFDSSWFRPNRHVFIRPGGLSCTTVQARSKLAHNPAPMWLPNIENGNRGLVVDHTRPQVDIVGGHLARSIQSLWLVMILLGCGRDCHCHVISPGVMSLMSFVPYHNSAVTPKCTQRGRSGVPASGSSIAAAALLESSERTLRNVIVTGANRGLGFAIADRMLTLGGYRVVLACRSQEEGSAALERLRAHQQERQQQGKRLQGSVDPLELPASVHILDVSCDRSIETFRESCVDDYLGGRIDFLFNNAGVCLPEENEDGTKNRSAAAGVLQETLTVNFFGGLKVVENCVPALTAAATTPIMHDGQATGGAVAPAEVDAVTTGMMPLAPPTVVWISSGEGELCFLGSKWRGLLADAKNLQDVKRCVSDLLDSATATESCATPVTNELKTGGNTAAADAQKQREEENSLAESQEEIAFGPTPSYSLSKAAVNAAVRTWAPDLLTLTATSRAPGAVDTGTGGAAGGVRLIAVCPGDVLTRMTSEEELSRGDAVSPKEAAVVVVDVALGPTTEFPTGSFYRDGKQIGW